MTKVTIFTKGKSQPRETFLKHDVLLEKRKKMIDNYEDKIGEQPQPKDDQAASDKESKDKTKDNASA